jgi:hypothetical protein
MAATHGRLTGKPGVCLATLGPGALNFTTGAAYAMLGAMPMIMITGQKASRARRQARFQLVDIVATMAPLTKMARQIVSPATIPSIVREAFRVAQQERPGPVHLELPEDIAHETVGERAAHPAPSDRIPIAHPASLDRAADDPPGRAPAGHAGRRRQPPAPVARLVRFRPPPANPVLQHPDGQGRRRWAAPSSISARPPYRSATMCTTPSTAPT